MYDTAKKSRAANKAKAERLANRPLERVDSSDWTPPPLLNADVKTGMRPVSKQALKRGGKVHGEKAKVRADRVARKAGGRVEEKGEQPLVDRYINRDLKKANEYRDGIKHDGGLKRGGRAHKADGGKLSSDDAKKLFNQYGASKQAEDEKRHRLEAKGSPTGKVLQPRQALSLESSGLKRGGRAKKADGGPSDLPIKKGSTPKDFWTYQSGSETPSSPPSNSKMSKSEWETLSPGMRREIHRSFLKLPTKASGGRAGKANGGSMTMEEMIKKNPVPEKKSEFKMPNPVPVPPRRQEEKPKFKSKYDLTTHGMKSGGSAKLAKATKNARAKHKDGGRTKKMDGGPMGGDPRLNIVKPKAMEFGQNTVVPGLKKGGRAAKAFGGPMMGSAPQMPAQAMANAQGRPFQGGQFTPPGLANQQPMGDVSTQVMPPIAAGAPAAMPSMPPQAMGGMAPAMPNLPPQAAGAAMNALAGARPFARAAGGRTKGKTNINIVIAQAPKEGADQGAMPSAPPAGGPPQGIPVPVPPAGGAPMGGPMGAPPMPPPPMGAPRPTPFKKGGRVSKVAHSYKDMTAGAGSGEGRLQKTDIAERVPKKAGGKVYRSYKDMDAGAGSGFGRLEKTEIQSKKSRKG